MASPPRRVTRSQSREQETSIVKDVGQSSGGRMWTQSLEVLPEESPYKSPRKSTARFVPGSPEDAGNITGTTIRVSEHESELDPQMMLYTLPDLESYATGVLDFVLPATKTGSVAELAKKLADSKSLQHLQFRRRVSKLTGETQNFSHATYIDVAEVHQLFYELFESRGMSTAWSADGILHKANCALFARELLLAADWAPFRRAITNVADLFPSAFMNDIAHEDASQSLAAGESALAMETFQLALEIRTQSLIMQIEDRQGDPAFDPVEALGTAFFLEHPGEDAPLRGFDLDGLGGVDAPLPARFRDAALERYADVRELLVENEGYVLRVLKSVYRWQKFIPRAVGWIAKRSDEINEDLRKQQSTEEFHAEFFASKDSFNESVGAEAATEASIQEAPPAESPVPAERPEPKSEARSEPEQRTRPQTQPQQQDKDRRKSGRSEWYKGTISSLMQRIQREKRASEGPSIRRESDNAPAPEPRRVSAPVLQRPTTPARAEQEIPESDSPTPFRDEEELNLNDDTHLDLPDTTQHSLEKSQSPPMTTRTTSTLGLHPSDAELWAAAKATPQPDRARHRRPAAFIDRQSTAHRISPISQDASVERRRESPATAPTRKRPRDDSDDFERYERAVDVRRRRAEKPDQSRHKRLRRDDSDSDSDSPARQLRNGMATTSPTTQPSPRRSTPRVEVPPPSTASSIITTTDRKRWLPQEDNRLIRMMRLFGVKWAKIEKENPIQPLLPDELSIEDRNQVQLKDRARNLKMKFYREGQPLPPNFDKVTMGKKYYDQLRRLGITVPE
ncbi:hypothetical protein ATEIFO6365_0010024700 [Aspergillus terreus]|uniref:Uncharacterized protein n=1 Tax=Aspergillus terreus TaxID=33178 RepID=A0A5M3ZDN1_ASPTE|nr:hypothetical protein ATETN484_0012022600 [Aspergillus terreus]GFF19474.1 hypothetical protein ATEIFO6365_0010024700 [Aspergillus terreus]